MVNDPDKKVEELKEKRESVYQSTQQSEHFKNEGSEYRNSHTEENNDISKNADYDKIHNLNKEKKTKEASLEKSEEVPIDNHDLLSADDPNAGEDSAIPGAGKKGEIATPAAEAGLGGNMGRGTSNFPNKE